MSRPRKFKYLPSKSANLFLMLIQQTYGITIEREYQLEGRYFDGRYKNLLIEVDGSYWHSKPAQVLIDKKKKAIAERNGFNLVRFTVNSAYEAPKKLLEARVVLDPLMHLSLKKTHDV